jgi:hypothetical protein
MDDFSLARPAGHLIMGDGSGPDGLAKRDGAKALSGAESGDTATTPLHKPPRTKNLITESYELDDTAVKTRWLGLDFRVKEGENVAS